MNRRVPVVATWLLERFGVKRQNEALMGDLAEEYQAGKSRMWYWWQTLVAIWVAVVRDVREHKLLALRAVAMAWIMMRVLGFIYGRIILPRVYPGWTHLSSSGQAAFLVSRICWELLGWVLIGWLVARTHRAQAGAMMLTVVTWRILFTAWYFGDFVLSRPHPFSIQNYSLAVLTTVPFQILMLVAGSLLVMAGKQPEQPAMIA